MHRRTKVWMFWNSLCFAGTSIVKLVKIDAKMKKDVSLKILENDAVPTACAIIEEMFFYQQDGLAASKTPD